MGKPNSKGRDGDRIGSKDAVLIIRRSLWQSPRVSQLSPAARALMVELLSMYNGTNNGKLFLSVRDATDRLGFSDWRSADAAFQDLIESGLVTCTFKGLFSITAGETSRATAWNLNWIGPKGDRLSVEQLPAVDEGSLPSRTRKRLARRQSAMKRYHKEREAGKYSVVETTTLEARRVVETTKRATDTAVETPTVEVENPANPPSDHLVETTTYILHHIPDAFSGSAAPLEVMRASISDWWRTANRKERIGLAKQHQMEIGELSSFVAGLGDLPIQKAMALRVTVAGPTGCAA